MILGNKAIENDEKLRRVLGAMALENLSLSEDMIAILKDCISGTITYAEGRQRILNSVNKDGDFHGKSILLSKHKGINK